MKVNLCIIGASGVGKSPLDNLLRKNVVTIEPYRARVKGARKDEMYFVSPAMLEELRTLNKALTGEPILSLDSDKGEIKPFKVGKNVYRQHLEVYSRASFFTVRKTQQILLHQQNVKPYRKIEIFAPALSQILANNDARIAIPFFERVDKTVFLLLNPLPKSIRTFNPNQIINGTGWKRQTWKEIQVKRDELKGKKVDLNEVNTRIDFLPVEAQAWRLFAEITDQDQTNFGFIEVLNWSHFEYKYLEEKGSKAKEELRSAKADILDASQREGLENTLKKFIQG